MTLAEVLADRRSVQPIERCRIDLDYAEILKRQRASTKVRRVFKFLADTHGQGAQKELARTMHVSPPRIVQLKHKLAACLAAGGYAPAGWVAQRRAYRRSRGRMDAVSLNVGTTPVRSPRLSPVQM